MPLATSIQLYWVQCLFFLSLNFAILENNKVKNRFEPSFEMYANNMQIQITFSLLFGSGATSSDKDTCEM